MKLLFHGFNMYAAIVLGGFGFFGIGLAAAAARYRNWVKRGRPQHR